MGSADSPGTRIIAIPLSQDAEYTHQMLAALSQCHGLSDYKVLMSMDWNEAYDERSYNVYALALSFASFYGHPATEVRLHKPGMGAERNKQWLIATALKEAEFAIILDDSSAGGGFESLSRDGAQADSSPACSSSSACTLSRLLPHPDFLHDMEQARGEHTASARLALDGKGNSWSPVVSKARPMRFMP